MRSELQRQASRINGAKSRGPVTAIGKQNSSRGRTSHGVYSGLFVVPDKSLDCFFNIFKSLNDELKPETPAEKELVHKMFTAQWRQMRLWNYAKAPDQLNRFTHQDAATFRSHVDSLLRAKEMPLVRGFARAHAKYLKIRKPNPDPLND